MFTFFLPPRYVGKTNSLRRTRRESPTAIFRSPPDGGSVTFSRLVKRQRPLQLGSCSLRYTFYNFNERASLIPTSLSLELKQQGKSEHKMDTDVLNCFRRPLRIAGESVVVVIIIRSRGAQRASSWQYTEDKMCRVMPDTMIHTRLVTSSMWLCIMKYCS